MDFSSTDEDFIRYAPVAKKATAISRTNTPIGHATANAGTENASVKKPRTKRITAYVRFVLTCLDIIQAAVLATPEIRKRSASTGNVEKTDEIDILALMTIAGVDVGLIHVLPVFYITEIASRKTSMLSGKISDKKGGQKRRFYLMSDAEIREEYGRR